MKTFRALISGAFFVGAALLIADAPEVLAQSAKAQSGCVDKAGRGWGGSVDSARFQAWEAVLQDTSWGMWAVWMTSGAKVGTAASGYKVSNLREKCGNDGSNKVCVIRAKLCK